MFTKAELLKSLEVKRVPYTLHRDGLVVAGYRLCLKVNSKTVTVTLLGNDCGKYYAGPEYKTTNGDIHDFLLYLSKIYRNNWSDFPWLDDTLPGDLSGLSNELSTDLSLIPNLKTYKCILEYFAYHSLDRVKLKDSRMVFDSMVDFRNSLRI